VHVRARVLLTFLPPRGDVADDIEQHRRRVDVNPNAIESGALGEEAHYDAMVVASTRSVRRVVADPRASSPSSTLGRDVVDAPNSNYVRRSRARLFR